MMSEYANDNEISTLFTEPELQADPAFTETVMAQVQQQHEQLRRRRMLVGILLGLLLIPLEDLAIGIAHLLAVSLIQIEHELASQLLAPINTVGALLSLVLLLLRMTRSRFRG